MNVRLESVPSCGVTSAKYNMVFNCCCREEAEKVRNTFPLCLTDCGNNIIVNIIVKCGCEVIGPCGCESNGPISFSNLIPVKRCNCCDPEHFCSVMTSSNPCTSEALSNCPEMFVCSDDEVLKITFLFNERGSCRCCNDCNNRCNSGCNSGCNNGLGGGFGCGLEWLFLLFLC